MRILALDPATVMGVADGIAGGVPALSVVRLRLKDTDEYEDLLGRAGEWLWRRLVLGKPDLIAIEKPVPPHKQKGFTNYSTTQITQGLYGGIVMIARAANVRVMPAHIATWRKCVLGKGNMAGADAKRAMMEQCRRLGWAAETYDAAEAAGIHIWASGVARLGAVAA